MHLILLWRLLPCLILPTTNVTLQEVQRSVFFATCFSPTQPIGTNLGLLGCRWQIRSRIGMLGKKGDIRTVTNRSNTNIKEWLKEKVKHLGWEDCLQLCEKRTTVLFAQQPLRALLSIRNALFIIWPLTPWFCLTLFTSTDKCVAYFRKNSSKLTIEMQMLKWVLGLDYSFSGIFHCLSDA